jgi:hypothetical protein
MPKSLSHEEIAQRLVDAKVIDYHAMGKFVAELGPALAVGDQGLHGVVFGRFNTLACMIPAVDAARLVGNLRNAGVANAALESAFEGTLGK